VPAKDLYERSQEIGQLIQQARLRARKSIRQCATYLGTSRERYASFETGKVYISVVEMEALMRYLGIPYHEIWPAHLAGDPEEVILEAMPGQSIRIKVNVALANVMEGSGQLATSLTANQGDMTD
jgi:transcriptional regulator with XRE-family HTH domain